MDDDDDGVFSRSHSPKWGILSLSFSLFSRIPWRAAFFVCGRAGAGGECDAD